MLLATTNVIFGVRKLYTVVHETCRFISTTSLFILGGIVYNGNRKEQSTDFVENVYPRYLVKRIQHNCHVT